MNELVMILYHENCWDGEVALFYTLEALAEAGISVGRIVGINHGEPRPEVHPSSQYSRIYYLDCSPTGEEVERLRHLEAEVIVIDHHITAIRRLTKYDGMELVLDEKRSGAMLVWGYFGQKGLLPTRVPRIIKYVQDHDLWRFELPYSRAVLAVMNSYPRCQGSVRLLIRGMEENWPDLYSQGGVLLRAQEMRVSELREKAFSANFGLSGEELIQVVQCQDTTLVSPLGAELAKDAAYVILWRVNQACTTVSISLRAREYSTDVSILAAREGGGGHRCAAGYTLPLVEWVDTMKKFKGCAGLEGLNG